MAAIGIVPLVAGCIETGDFNRPRVSIWNTAIGPVTGSLSPFSRSLSLSRNALTNDEEELRNRAWRFIMPAHERTLFDSAVVAVVQTHSLPAETLVADPAAYLRALLSEPYRSPSSRYRRLSGDIVADRLLLAPFRAVAGRVMSADRVRARAIERIGDLSQPEIDNAEWRMAENVGIVAWVRERVAVRICQYRFALDHYVVEAPQSEAIGVERALAALVADSRALDRLDIGALTGAGQVPQTGHWVRPLPVCRGIALALPGPPPRVAGIVVKP